MEGQGAVIGDKAIDFELQDQRGEFVKLGDFLANGPCLIAFYPGDFTMVCTKQLCSYRDRFSEFRKLGIQIVGISKNSLADHAKFIKHYDFPFSLLADPGSKIAAAYGCTSKLMLGGMSRAVFIISQQRKILYRYVEPTTFTHRKSEELLGIITDMRKHNII